MREKNIRRGSAIVGVSVLVGAAVIAPMALRLGAHDTTDTVDTNPSRTREASPIGSSRAGGAAHARVRSRTVAAPRVERAGRSDPRAEVTALESLAARYSDVQEDDSAHEAAARCLALDPANAQCAVLQLRSSMRTGEFDRARDETVRCFDLAPSNGTCVYADAMIRLHDGDVDGATASLGELRDVEGDSTMVRVVSASIAMRRGDRATAMADLHEACSRGQPWACGMERRVDEERDARGVRGAMRTLLAMVTADGR